MNAHGILVVGGYGVVGGRIAAEPAPDYPDRVIVAGRDLERANAAATAIGHGVRGRVRTEAARLLGREAVRHAIAQRRRKGEQKKDSMRPANPS